jgi:hypothetical protein
MGALACEEDKPYTPFQVATALPNDSPPSTGPEKPSNDTQENKPAPKALRAPAGSTRWKAWGTTLVAPEQTIFSTGIRIPNSESEEILAWALPRPGVAGAKNGGVWVFDSAGRAKRLLLPLPEFLPQGKDCQRAAAFQASGPRTVTATIEVSCESDVLAGTPVRSVAILDPSRESPVLVHLRTSEPARGETLSFRVDSSDRDGDGQDDGLIEVSLKAPSGESESLPLRWLVRTAGASREPDAPRKDLLKRTSRLLTASIRRAERGKAPGQVDALRRLLSALCSELGRPKIERASGAPLPCGDLKDPLERLVKVNIQSYLGEEKLTRALGEAERANWFGKKPPSFSVGDLLKKKVDFTKAKREARFRIVVASSQAPHRTPLVFDDDGQLWAVTTEKTKRLTMEGDPPLVTPATDDEPEVRLEPPSWSIDAKSPGGIALRAAIPSCERSEVLLAFDSAATPVPLPLLSPRPGDCSGFAPAPLPVEPLYFKGETLTFVVGGEVLTSRGHEHTGSGSLAWGTSFGLALLHQGELSLFTGAETDGLHHCAVNQKATRIACVDGDGVSVFSTKTAKSSP